MGGSGYDGLLVFYGVAGVKAVVGNRLYERISCDSRVLLPSGGRNNSRNLCFVKNTYVEKKFEVISIFLLDRFVEQNDS